MKDLISHSLPPPTVPPQVNVTVEKEVAGFWVKVPCMEKVGSCHYPDACALLDELIPPGQECPPPLSVYELPCHCPFKAVSPPAFFEFFLLTSPFQFHMKRFWFPLVKCRGGRNTEAHFLGGFCLGCMLKFSVVSLAQSQVFPVAWRRAGRYDDTHHLDNRKCPLFNMKLYC